MNGDRWPLAALLVVAVLGGIYAFGNTGARGNTSAPAASSRATNTPFEKGKPPASSAPAMPGAAFEITSDEACARAGGLRACVFLEGEP